MAGGAAIGAAPSCGGSDADASAPPRGRSPGPGAARRRVGAAGSAYQPWPGSYIESDKTVGGRLIVWQAHVAPAEPGDVDRVGWVRFLRRRRSPCRSDPGQPFVTREGRLVLDVMQVAGGRPMSAAEYRRGSSRSIQVDVERRPRSEGRRFGLARPAPSVIYPWWMCYPRPSVSIAAIGRIVSRFRLTNGGCGGAPVDSRSGDRLPQCPIADYTAPGLSGGKLSRSVVAPLDGGKVGQTGGSICSSDPD